ncbi:sensor domain-containing protein [Rhodococcus sp. CH91]|uniref:sensor domain-containing protein n=1 Tax=Rhodococcus sp. CH91 TaxID=2910256 RepID=UPI001F4A694D|nr:sensor domain-containing protein [Rhodococcus sp. CH91]
MTHRDARPGHRTSAVLLACALLVPACSSTIPGDPRPEPAALTATAADPSRARPPAELLLPPERFPESYPAVVLPAAAVAQAAPDLTGIQPGSKVDPGGCLPPVQDYGPGGTAMAVGTDDASRATISVEIARSVPGLEEYRTYLSECSRVEATVRGITSTVVTVPEDDPTPPVAGAQTLALTRTVRSGRDAAGVTQSMTTRVAQIADVRVTVTYMSFDAAPPDVGTLDRVFRDAVVHAARP